MSQPVTTSECPNVMTLTMYVSGSLEEDSAARLPEHLERCSRCRKIIDDMVPEPDSLIKALRRPPKQTLNRNVELDRLIAEAESFDPQNESSSPRRRSNATVPVESFIDCLRKSRLFSTDEVKETVETITASDSVTFAREMITRRQLTPFQAKALTRGLWKGLVLGNYIVLDKLGQGGMGHVFKARHKRMERIVCLKVLGSTGRKSPEILDRFRREARTVAALNHSNIVVAHDAGEAEGIPFLVMEFVQGSDLARYVSRRGPLPVNTVVRLILQVAQALEYAHGEGVVHRDIKPHNLLLEDSGTVKILDMGLARFDSYLGNNADATTHTSMTTTGIVMGTVDYMSPEQALNSSHADSRSDVYSLGCTLFYLLTGRVLYDGETVMEKLVAHREREIPGLSETADNVPAALDAIFQKMVAKSPDDRYQSMSELAGDLQAFLNGEVPQAVLQIRFPEHSAIDRIRSKSPLRKRLLPWGALILAVALISGAIYLATRPSGSPGSSKGNPSKSKKVAESSPTPQPQMQGHPQTLFNGGPGRVLVVVPYNWFYEDHFLNITDALQKRGVDVQTASSKMGYANPKHNYIKPVQTNMPLETFDVFDFDAVIFVGGNTGEFTHKSPAGIHASRIILESLEKQRVIASVGDGSNAIHDTGILKDSLCNRKRGCDVCSVKGRPGTVITTSETKHSSDLVALIFDEVLKK